MMDDWFFVCLLRHAFLDWILPAPPSSPLSRPYYEYWPLMQWSMADVVLLLTGARAFWPLAATSPLIHSKMHRMMEDSHEVPSHLQYEAYADCYDGQGQQERGWDHEIIEIFLGEFRKAPAERYECLYVSVPRPNSTKEGKMLTSFLFNKRARVSGCQRCKTEGALQAR